LKGRHGGSRSLPLGIVAALAAGALVVGGAVVESARSGGAAVESARSGGAAVESARSGAAAVESARSGAVSAALPASHALQRDFAAAAREFHVPESVLLAVSYHETLWESHSGQPSATGNYNVMGLTQLDASRVAKPSAGGRMQELDLRGDGRATHQKPSPSVLADLASVPVGPAAHTLAAAARLTGSPASALRSDMRQSVRGGAALLASYERAAVGSLPGNPGRWYAAVARYTQSTDAAGARLFADRVYATIRGGASRTTADGQQVTLAAAPSVTPQRTQLRSLGLPAAPTSAAGTTPECPSGLACSFVAAAYAQTNPADPTAYGNYDHASRPADGDAIQYIVIHDTEGSYTGTIAAFQNPTDGASAHYVISASGQVTQMVLTKDVAWHAGNWYVNMHAIGIEHEGYALQGASWYTESEYESSAALVRYLTAKYGIPLDRQHIIGHDDVPGPLQSYVAGMHWDPGTYWDWNHYLALIGAPLGGTGGGTPLVGGEITIAPPFTSANEPTVTGCGTSGTSTCPAQPANFVYLRTSPSATAPLIHDTVLHPTATAGTTGAADWTDKAVAGQSFIVAAQQGAWTAIWYQGQKAWFYNPAGENAVANGNAAQAVVTPKAGATSIPVYGRAYPSPSSYPPVLQSVSQQASQQLTPLSYTIPAGQGYLAGSEGPGTYFYTENYDQSAPGDHTLVTDTGTMYYPIRYNHRIAFVMASDVQAVPVTAPPPSTYIPDGPTRIMDTRYGIGVAKRPVGANSSISLQVAGKNGVPGSGVTAVVMNVTVTGATAGSYVTVYPDGQPRPGTSSLDFVKGETIPNLVIVPVVDGKVDFYNLAGTVNIIADLTGYYSAGGSSFTSAGPTRIMDTRYGTGGIHVPVGAGGSISLRVGGVAGLPAGVTAVIMNVTVVGPTAASYVTVYPDGQPRPGTSSLDFVKGETIPNLVIVPVVDGKVDFYNNAGTVNLIADITGYYAG